jgi:hypothetical protein
MFMFIFSTAVTIVVIGIVVWLGWLVLSVGLICGGIFAWEDTQNIAWLGLSMLGLCFASAGLR